MTTMHHRFEFPGPDGQPVDVDVIRDITLIRPACSAEPADFKVVTRMFVNEAPADPARYQPLVEYVEEYGRRLS